MKIENLEPGQVVFDVSRSRLGNATLTSVVVWQVTIVSIDLQQGNVVARWNGNPQRKYSTRQVSKWRASKPLLIKSGLGQRLATRAEIAAHKLAAAPGS